MNSEFIDLIDIANKPQDVAIDFYKIGYFGDKSTIGIRGIKPKNGTSFGYSYLPIDLIGDFKLTPGIDYIMAAKSKQQINKMLDGHIKNDRALTIF